jgi:glucosylceramidase
MGVLARTNCAIRREEGEFMPESTRRDFLRLAAAASLAASNGRLLWGSNAPKTQAWVTSKDRKLEEVKLPEWKNVSGETPTGIVLDPTKRYQPVLGFGAAFTDASCYILSQLDAEKRAALLAELFGPDGLRLSVCRTCIGASDYSRFAYSYDDTIDADPDLVHFSIDHDREYILPTLRAARKINPDLFLFACPWSPPGWMKANGSLLGGSMRKKYMPAYAQYFVKFLEGYLKEGVRVQAVTVQNEVDTDQDGRMPAALWGQEYEVEFVKKYLGSALEQASLDTKIWILDHNYNLWGRVLDELNDPDFSKYVDGVAWHAYAGTPDAMTRVHEAFPAKNTYWTEGGPNYRSFEYATDWVRWSRTFSGILKNWSQCIVGWNLALDEQGRPNIGPAFCGGLVTVDSQTHAVTRSGQYWAFAHYSKHVQRGAQVISSVSQMTEIDHVAFENPDGTHVLVITNPGIAQKIVCQNQGQALELTLEQESITSLHW